LDRRSAGFLAPVSRKGLGRPHTPRPRASPRRLRAQPGCLQRRGYVLSSQGAPLRGSLHLDTDRDEQFGELLVVREDPDRSLELAWLEPVLDRDHPQLKDASRPLAWDVDDGARTFRGGFFDTDEWKGGFSPNPEVLPVILVDEDGFAPEVQRARLLFELLEAEPAKINIRRVRKHLLFQEGENRYLDLPLVRAQRNTLSCRARRGRRQELHGEFIALPAFYHCQLHGEAIPIRAVPQDLERALIAIHNGDDARLRLGFPSKRAEKNGGARQHLDRAPHSALDAAPPP